MELTMKTSVERKPKPYKGIGMEGMIATWYAKNTGKNVLARSLSGIGQVGSLLVGRGSLNQPFSAGDMLRERVSNNIGQASDEQVSRLALTEHVVVTIPANTPIYVVLEKNAIAKTTLAGTPGDGPPLSNSANTDELGLSFGGAILAATVLARLEIQFEPV